MLKRSLVILSLALMLFVAAEPVTHGVLMTPDEVDALYVTSPEPSPPDGKGGNSFVRALKAPFKAIGKLFGKKDEQFHRLSEKDVKKFESAGVTRTVDARLVPPSETNTASVSPDPALTPADQKLAQARQNLEQGQALLNSGNLNDAIGFLSAATSLNPKLAEAFSLLGVAYESKGLREQAFRSFETALKINDKQPELLNNLGYLHYKNGDYDTAAKYLQRAVKLAPNKQRFWNNLGLVQAQRGKFDDAYKCFARAVGEYEGHMNVANRLQALGYEKEAVVHLEKARILQPNSKEILVRLISLYKRTGRPEACGSSAELVRHAVYTSDYPE